MQSFLSLQLQSNPCRRALALIAIAVMSVAGGCQSNGAPAAAPGPASPAGELVASGFIEADEVAISSEIGGRITAIAGAEGADARAGQVLVELERATGEAELRVAQARLLAAQAALAQLKAGARPEEIRQTEASVALAQANCDAAQQAWQDAQMLLSQQQTLDLQILQARTQVDVARARVGAASAAQAGAQIVKDRFTVPLQDYSYWQSWIGVNTAGASYDGAQATLASLEAQRKAALAQRTQVDAASSTYQAAQAALAQAAARLADLRAGATAEQVAVAEAQVRVADAGVRAVQARLDKLTLHAPAGGQVVAHNLKVGELAAPGATILTLADLDSVSLVVYVPADRLGRVRLGAKVPVQVDGLPGRTFDGEVVHIADKAEFVPDNVQSSDERASLVFAVKLRLANPGHLLKPGVPADAHWQGA